MYLVSHWLSARAITGKDAFRWGDGTPISPELDLLFEQNETCVSIGAHTSGLEEIPCDVPRRALCVYEPWK